MTQLTEKDVHDVAELAHIAMTPEYVKKYHKELGGVLTYFEKLQEVDTDKIKEIGHITGMENVYREDVVEDCGEHTKNGIRDNIPSTDGGHIAVKSIL